MRDSVATSFGEETHTLTTDRVLSNRATQFGDRPFVYYGPSDREVSFLEFDRTANQLANGFMDLGVTKGAEVSTLLSNPLVTVQVVFGLAKSGAVYAPINFENEGSPLAYQLNDTAPELLIVEERFLPRLAEVADAIRDELRLVVVGDESPQQHERNPFEAIPYEQCLESSADPPGVDTSWRDTASIVYTSGTTGQPKGVRLPNRWIYANYINLRRGILSPEDVVHTSLPLYHIGGLYWDIVAALTAGASVSLWDRFSVNEFWDRVDRYDATTTTLVSVMMSWLKKQPGRDDDHRNTLNKVHVQPLLDDYAEFADRFGFDFLTVSYGQTEAGVPINGLIHVADDDGGTPASMWRGYDPGELTRRAGELGIPVVGRAPGERYMGRVQEGVHEVAVLDEADERLPPNEPGELALRPIAPYTLFERYHGKPRRTLEAFDNLWFHTGDIVTYDEAGNYFFVDRKDNIIRRRGENISPKQVEQPLTTIEAVEEAVAFPVPAPEGGEDEIAVAVKRTDESLTEEALFEVFAEELPEFMIPRYIWFRDDFPTTETNKIRVNELRERFLEENLTGG